MLDPKILKLDWLQTGSLAGGHRFVFQMGPGGGQGGGNPGEDSSSSQIAAAEAQQQEALDRQERQEEQEQVDDGNPSSQRRNQQHIRRLEQLSARDAISGETLAQATDALQSNDRYRQSAARLLAVQRINGATFDTAYECLESGNNSEKALARGFVSGRLTQDSFTSAVSDLDSNDQYESRLARRLAMRRINGEEYERAREGLRSTDVDVQRASQMLALGGLTPQAFRDELQMAARANEEAQLNPEEETSPVDAQRERTHDQIIELLLQANVLIEELPERERTRPLLRLRNNLRDINTRDTQNQTALSVLLRQINEEEEHLTEKERNEIWNFTADTKDEFTQFRERLGQMDLTSSQRKNIIRLKAEEYDIEERFITEAKIFDSIMKASSSMVLQERRREQMIEEATQTSGINIEKGTQIQYVTPNAISGNMQTVTIHNVETVVAPIMNRQGEVIGSQPTNLRIHLDNGETHSLGRFIKWVEAADVHETINSQAELDQKLGLPELGVTLQSGQQLEYNTGYNVNRKGNIVPQRDNVQVVSVSDNGVELAEPVVTLTPEQAPHVGLTAPRMSREMNLGEFAKWARRNEAMPDVTNLPALREHLRNMSNHRNQTMNRSPQAYPPIRVEKDEVVKFGDENGRKFQIKKADDDEVTFQDGTKMTLPAFLVWARNNNVESSMPEPESERAADAASNLGDEPRKKAKKNAFKKAMADIFSGNKKTDDGKSFFEKMDPYIPSREHPYGYFQELYAQTTFLSMMDIYNMGKEIIELVKRKHQRRSKSRFGNVGKNLPGVLGTEMNRITQAAENEEVNQYKEAMEQWGVWEVLSQLHGTSSKDEAKACFLVLTEKGELRWDDMRMWGTLNILTSKFTHEGAKLFIPINEKPQPHPETGIKTSGEDRAREAMDALWGEGQGADWFSKNTNAFNSNKSAYEYKGKTLEHDPKSTGGLAGELTRLLKEWKTGKYVNPHEYEELIDFGIKYGKMSGEEKIFFLFEGITAKCPSGPMSGMTLLHLDRIGELDGVYLNQFPMLDFFTNKLPKPQHPKFISGETDEVPKGGYKVEDFEYFRDKYFKEDSKNCEVSKNFSKFLWEHMVVDPYFRLRLSKGLRRAEAMDHDDAHIFIPPAGLEELGNLTRSYQGNQKFFTPEGYKNGYCGFNQYIVSLSNRYEELNQTLNNTKEPNIRKALEDLIKETEDQMMNGVQGYLLYDSYLSGRNDQRDPARARLDREHYKQVAVNDLSSGDDFTVGQHQAQLSNLVKEVCEDYGIDWQKEMLFEGASYNDRQKQSDIAAGIDNFLKNSLPQKIIEMGPKQMFAIVKRRKLAAQNGNHHDENALRGIPDSNNWVTLK